MNAKLPKIAERLKTPCALLISQTSQTGYAANPYAGFVERFGSCCHRGADQLLHFQPGRRCGALGCHLYHVGFGVHFAGRADHPCHSCGLIYGMSRCSMPCLTTPALHKIIFISLAVTSSVGQIWLQNPFSPSTAGSKPQKPFLKGYPK